jgi:hypothetical protein
LPVTVISEIPEIISADDERLLKRKTWLGWVTAAMVLVTILAGSALSFFRG